MIFPFIFFYIYNMLIVIRYVDVASFVSMFFKLYHSVFWKAFSTASAEEAAAAATTKEYENYEKRKPEHENRNSSEIRNLR